MNMNAHPSHATTRCQPPWHTTSAATSEATSRAAQPTSRGRDRLPQKQGLGVARRHVRLGVAPDEIPHVDPVFVALWEAGDVVELQERNPSVTPVWRRTARSVRSLHASVPETLGSVRLLWLRCPQWTSRAKSDKRSVPVAHPEACFLGVTYEVHVSLAQELIGQAALVILVSKCFL